MANKTDKELAVELAKAYIEASGHSKMANGASKNLAKVEAIIEVIEAFHATLKKLD